MKRTLVLALGCLLLAGCGGHSSSRKSAAATGTSSSSSPVTSSTPSTPSSASTAPQTSGGAAAPAAGPVAGPVAAGAPQVTSVQPSSGPLDGGSALTIQGSGFTAPGAGTTLVLFGDQAVVQATPISDTEIQLVAPVGKTAGALDLRVVNDLGAGLASGAWTYDPRPAALSFTPAVGHHEVGQGGTRITIELRGFAPLSAAAAVRFDQTAAAAVTVIDADTVVAEVPDGLAPGRVAITVLEGAQQVTAANFLVQGALAYGDLTVNEVCCNPAGLDLNRDGVGNTSGDEFVELINTTAEPIDLSYLTLHDAVGERHRFPNPTTLPPGGALVVFGAGTPLGYAAPHASGSAQAATSGQLGLNNGGDTVTIQTLPGATGTPTVLFTVTLTTAGTGVSSVNRSDGQRIRSNPASDADYEAHGTAPNAQGDSSPGARNDGTPF